MTDRRARDGGRSAASVASSEATGTYAATAGTVAPGNACTVMAGTPETLATAEQHSTPPDEEHSGDAP